MWSIDDGEINVNLQKMRKAEMWVSALEGHGELDPMTKQVSWGGGLAGGGQSMGCSLPHHSLTAGGSEAADAGEVPRREPWLRVSGRTLAYPPASASLRATPIPELPSARLSSLVPISPPRRLPPHSFSNADFNGSVPDARDFMGGVKYT